MNEQKADSAIGLYEKFNVTRTDGRSSEGEKHHGCEYFVLDLNHDPFAYSAIVTYARHCADKYPELADDLLAKARKMSLWMTDRTLADMRPEDREAWSRMIYNDPERR